MYVRIWTHRFLQIVFLDRYRKSLLHVYNYPIYFSDAVAIRNENGVLSEKTIISILHSLAYEIWHLQSDC